MPKRVRKRPNGDEQDDSDGEHPETHADVKPKTDIKSASTSKRRRVEARDFEPVDAGSLPLLSGTQLDLADSEVYYVRDFVDKDTAESWYAALLELETWYQPTLRMYGRSFTQSRQIVAYGSLEAADSIKYSGTEVPLEKEHPAIMREIQEHLESRLRTTFNHCMLNRYDDGSVYIGSHSDNLENLCIASISLGAERDFVLQHKKKPADAAGDDERNKKRWPLANGSLLIMQGDTQKFWKHEIPKQLRIKTGRISLTFRQLIDK